MRSHIGKAFNLLKLTDYLDEDCAVANLQHVYRVAEKVGRFLISNNFEIRKPIGKTSANTNLAAADRSCSASYTVSQKNWTFFHLSTTFANTVRF